MSDAESAAIAAGEEVLHPHDRATEESVREQMQSMFARDRLMAIGFVTAVLIIVPFVLIAVWGDIPSTGIKVVLVVACAVILSYNAAAIAALVSGFRRDRDFVYRRDVAHLRERDALRASRSGR
jgi:hypothetical protein